MKNKFSRMPKDGLGESMQLPPETVISVHVGTNPSAAEVVSVPAESGIIEVQADGGHVYLKYGNDTAVSSLNFHERIQNGFCRHYKVPNGAEEISLIGGAGCTGYVVIFR